MHYPFTEIRQNFNPEDKQLQNAHVCLYSSPNRREQYIGIAWGILFILGWAFGDASVKISRQVSTHFIYSYLTAIFGRFNGNMLIDMETLKRPREKVIIAVFGLRNNGKSTAIMELVNRFPFEPNYTRIHPKEELSESLVDIVCKGQFTSKRTGKKVRLGICSYGDSKALLEEHFLPLVIDHNCDVIVVACHNFRETEGNTYNYIAEVALDNNYRLISTSILHDDDIWWKETPFTPFHVNCVNINEIFAKNMINLIKSIV